ncbi:hypothetical protein T440DRAFT_465415 [Plenodomus tracheiphilus IPT5]|uniref:Uncharacterized protein n=1 Tax=Plenodomus tracheiphilus IPT5 TaxID=1408161 RepID=A0A6A7BGB7_9PLEO|nr:hypothetical protein T440DRAFT_465415 [Plenodomus tracheiphilus IPT5]
MDNRAVRLPPNARRNIFHTTSRRQNPTTIRPDHEMPANIFQPPTEEEFVERDAQGEYKIAAPHPVYKNMALGVPPEEDEETSQDNEMISLYEKRNSHWDPKMVEEEIRVALKNSLRKKVASIEDDRWMFEGETEVGKK